MLISKILLNHHISAIILPPINVSHEPLKELQNNKANHFEKQKKHPHMCVGAYQVARVGHDPTTSGL